MVHFDFSFETLTAAQVARGVLNAGYIPGKILRAPKQIAAHGCGYVLRVQGRDGARAAEWLRENGAVFSKSFRVEQDGTSEEVRL